MRKTRGKKKKKTVQERRKLTIEEKLVILYPDISDKTKLDKVLGKFVATVARDPFQGKEIQPDFMEFNYPDFGFDNELQFFTEEGYYKHSPNWKFFMDYCSPFPKFERLNNYITFANNEKLERLMSEESRIGIKPTKSTQVSSNKKINQIELIK